ncbi:hypothetical protein [Tigheibacillus jepli]|uniref:hypothetical protein n=1 Tax=Tigheibacillus jepli TaxID=3035914 RepID=UPI00387E0E10
MESHKFRAFLQIARKLNEIQITPLLMGSVGLEVVTGKSWEAQDLDTMYLVIKEAGTYPLKKLYWIGIVL